MQVALIDDDGSLRRTLAALLRKSGFTIAVQAADGHDGLQQLAQSPLDLIITDCQMPVMDGITMARTLRARGDRTPIIMFSGHNDSEIIETALEAGVDRFISKPLQPDLFLSQILEVLADCHTIA